MSDRPTEPNEIPADPISPPEVCDGDAPNMAPGMAPPSATPAQPSEDEAAHLAETSQAGVDQPAGKTDTPAEGRIEYATVTDITADQVLVDLATNAQAMLPLIEFAGHPTPQVGDKVSVIIEKTDLETGSLTVSKRHADEVLFWRSVQPGDSLEGVVTGMNKGGLDIDIGGARAFLPSSQVDVRRVKDISVLIGEHVQCVVTQVDRTTKDLIVSRRKAIEKERKGKRESLFSTLKEGQTRSGKVSNITDYGMFVDIGGINGLVHITDLSWSHIKHPSEVAQPGQEIEVKILKIDRQKGKISLGVKQLTPDPWENAAAKYPRDARIKGRVARLADFGAFIELEPGIDALLPLSEMSWSRHTGKPSDIVKVGDEIETIVLKVDPDKRRISLSFRQLQDDPWKDAATRFPINDSFKGTVSKIMEFGAFVELTPGVEGLIHISELSDRRVKSVQDVVKEGQEVDVRILKVDSAAQRISLSMKPASSADRYEKTSETTKPKKKRTKPLRGGLSSHFDW